MAAQRYIVSALKHRPVTFAEVLAQDHVTRTLKHSLDRDQVANAFLFVGPRGTGKTTTARLLAKALNCENLKNAEPCNACHACRAIGSGVSPDVLEIDAASNRGVEEMEDLRENVRFSPMENRCKIYIIDEVHMLTTHAHNAFLKTLEEPPAHAKFILATTELHKIPETIVSRCQRFQFRRIPAQIIVEHLKGILSRQDEVEVADADELDRILYHLARASEGGLRDALGLLDQLLAFCSGKLTLADVQSILGVAEFDIIDQFLQSIIQHELPSLLRHIETVANRGLEFHWFLKECLLFLRNLAVVKVSPDSSDLLDMPEEYCAQLRQSVQTTTLEQLLYITDIFWQAEERMRYSSEGRMILELTAIKAAKAGQAVKIEDLLKKMRESGLPLAEAAAMGTQSASVDKKKHPTSATQPAFESPPFFNSAGTENQDGLAPAPAISAKSSTESGLSDPANTNGETAEVPSESPIQPDPPSAEAADARQAANTESISWQQILMQIETSRPFLSAALHPSRMLENDGQRIKIGISPQYERYFSQPRNRHALQAVLLEIYGKRFQLEFETQSELSDYDIEDESPAAAAELQPAPSKKELMEKIQQNEAFNKLMTMIPGHIVDVQPERKRRETRQ